MNFHFSSVGYKVRVQFSITFSMWIESFAKNLKFWNAFRSRWLWSLEKEAVKESVRKITSVWIKQNTILSVDFMKHWWCPFSTIEGSKSCSIWFNGTQLSSAFDDI